METTKRSLILLRYLGVWRPEHSIPDWKSNIYYCYTSFSLLLIGSVIITEIADLIMTVDGIQSTANRSFLLLTMIANFGKAVNMLIKRDEIIRLIRVLETDPCRPITKEELAIQHKFDKWIGLITSRHWGIMAAAATGYIFKSLLEDIPQRSFYYACRIEFDFDNSMLAYSIVYGWQIISALYSVLFTAAFDTFMIGMMMQVYSQLQILKHRFHRIPQISIDNDQIIDAEKEMILFVSADTESKLLAKCVGQHIEIFKFAASVNNIFSIMVFFQYFISTLVICTSVFGFSSTRLFSSEFTSLLMYIVCMIEQIFMYCYYGCEVTVESLTVADAIYATDWLSLSVNIQRSMVVIMARTLRPIEFSSGSIITLNLDSFTKLLKVSYSAFNVLQQKSV